MPSSDGRFEQLADGSPGTGRVVTLDADRATPELFDQARAESVDAIQAGRRRVSGTFRLAVKVADSQDMAAAGGCRRSGRAAGPDPWGDRNARVQAPYAMQLALFTPG